jgi:hypothetical protein
LNNAGAAAAVGKEPKVKVLYPLCNTHWGICFILLWLLHNWPKIVVIGIGSNV